MEVLKTLAVAVEQAYREGFQDGAFDWVMDDSTVGEDYYWEKSLSNASLQDNGDQEVVFLRKALEQAIDVSGMAYLPQYGHRLIRIPYSVEGNPSAYPELAAYLAHAPAPVASEPNELEETETKNQENPDGGRE